MDLQLPGIQRPRGHPHHSRQRNPTARIIVLTIYDGGRGYLPRAAGGGGDLSAQEHAVGRPRAERFVEVHEGKRPMPAEVALRLSLRDKELPLTPRELQVLELLAAGKRTKEDGAIS